MNPTAKEPHATRRPTAVSAHSNLASKYPAATDSEVSEALECLEKVKKLLTEKALRPAPTRTTTTPSAASFQRASQQQLTISSLQEAVSSLKQEQKRLNKELNALNSQHNALKDAKNVADQELQKLRRKTGTKTASAQPPAISE